MLHINTSHKSLPALVLCLFVLESCNGNKAIQGRAVDCDTNRGIAEAEIFLRTTEGTPMDRNQIYYVQSTDLNGEFKFIVEYERFEEIVAIADGYYPCISSGNGTLKLKRIGIATIPIERVEIPVHKDNNAKGYRFATKSIATKGEYDFSVAKKGEKFYVSAGKGGGVKRAGFSVQGTTGAWCEFFNATTATLDGYTNESEFSGLIYVKSSDGRGHAKILPILRTENVRGEITYEMYYAYQHNQNDVNLATDFNRKHFMDNGMLNGRYRHVQKPNADQKTDNSP